MDKRRVVFRADGHSAMGLGHVVRSAALAEMLASEFHCVLLYRDCPTGLLPALAESYQEVKRIEAPAGHEEDARELVAYASVAAGPDRPIVVLDGYHFQTDYQSTIIDSGCRLVCIDDIHAYHFVSHAIINHAGGVCPKHYSAEEYTKFCLGPKYALLRKAFREPFPMRTRQRNKTGFVCLGGADPPNATLSVLKKCVVKHPDYTFDVVLGAAYSHQAELDDYLGKASAKIRIHTKVSAENMSHLMAASSFGVTSPSTISFEYLSTGGTLYLMPIADNQDDIFAYYTSNGLAFSFKDEFPASERRIKAGIEKRANLFDGNTQQRYLQLFRSLTE